ncbi:MAG: FAD-dependent oxidoreductase [Chloroflexota bacterium]
MVKNPAKTKYLIIGNSAGAIGAVEAIRGTDKTGTITIVSDEPYPAYSRPLISEHLGKGFLLGRMLFRPADFYEKNKITTFLGKKAWRIDVDEHVVELESGEKIGWRKLLLATGGLPIVPQVKGLDLDGVFNFITLRDAMSIDQFLGEFAKRKTRAVVIGGGLIGVSVTEALVERGVHVTIVEMKDLILNTILDEEASALEAKTLKRAGVEIITGHTVSEISSYSGDDVTGVTLDDSRPIPCEMVVVAIGVRPRVDLTAGTDIKVNRGIVVDRHMATSNPDVFACGDAAETYDCVYDENRLVPIWPNAYLGGRVAGFNMAGVATEYSNSTTMNSLKYFGLAITSAGMANPPGDSYEVLVNSGDRTYKKVVLKDGLIMGLLFVGDIEKSGIIFNLMKDKVNVTEFKQTLVADDFGLSSLPEEIWRAMLDMKSPVSARAPDEKTKELVRGK